MSSYSGPWPDPWNFLNSHSSVGRVQGRWQEGPPEGVGGGGGLTVWAVFVAFRLCGRVLWDLGDLLCVWAGSEGELRNLAFARGLVT